MKRKKDLIDIYEEASGKPFWQGFMEHLADVFQPPKKMPKPTGKNEEAKDEFSRKIAKERYVEDNDGGSCIHSIPACTECKKEFSK